MALHIPAWIPLSPLVLGLLLTVIGSLMMAVGNVVMKVGITRASQRAQEIVNYPLSSPLWWSGITGYIIGALLHIAALPLAPASVLAPTNSVGLVANAIVAAMILNETMGWDEALATMGIGVGVILCAVAPFIPGLPADRAPSSPSHTSGDVGSWSDPWYLIYISVLLLSCLVALVWANVEETRAIDRSYDSQFAAHVRAGHVELAALNPRPNASAHDKLLHPQGETDVEPGAPEFPGHVGILYGFLSGCVGSQVVLEMKEVASLSVVAAEPFAMPQLYVALLFCIACMILQMHFLNLGLARGDATMVVPTYYVFWTLFGTIGGFAKFQESENLSNAQLGFFIVGLLLTVLCVGIMALGEVTHLQNDVDHAIPDESLADISQRARLRFLRLRLPLAIGHGILPVGRLAGRLRAPRGRNSQVRRVKSFDALPRPTSGPQGGPLGKYNWTLAGDPPSDVHRQFADLNRQRSMGIEVGRAKGPPPKVSYQALAPGGRKNVQQIRYDEDV